jgi:hypothetical protein
MNGVDKKDVTLLKYRNHIEDNVNKGKNRYDVGDQMEIIGFLSLLVIKKGEIARNKKNIRK